MILGVLVAAKRIGETLLSALRAVVADSALFGTELLAHAIERVLLTSSSLQRAGSTSYLPTLRWLPSRATKIGAEPDLVPPRAVATAPSTWDGIRPANRRSTQPMRERAQIGNDQHVSYGNPCPNRNIGARHRRGNTIWASATSKSVPRKAKDQLLCYEDVQSRTHTDARV